MCASVTLGYTVNMSILNLHPYKKLMYKAAQYDVDIWKVCVLGPWCSWTQYRSCSDYYLIVGCR